MGKPRRIACVNAGVKEHKCAGNHVNSFSRRENILSCIEYFHTSSDSSLLLSLAISNRKLHLQTLTSVSMGREMNTEGLGILCSGFGIADEDDDGNVRDYRKTEYCLDNLKDLQRDLRRDETRDVFMQLCKWNTLSRDLVPIIEHYQSDSNLVINVVKILVFLTMPVDPASEGVAQQIEYLWDLKAALTRNVTIAVIVSLLEQPLSNLESGDFTEDDWKLVQLVLTLFRNILAIQCITAQQKASGCANRFFHLTEKFLELMFQENIMDLILVLAQHVDDPDGYLRQDNLLLLEIFHYILLGQDPDLVAKASTINSKVNAGSTSADSLRLLIVAEDEKRRAIRQRNLGCHPQFSGAFTRIAMDGSKIVFKDPASALENGLAKVRKVQRGPLKKVASDNGVISLQENILELLHIFLNQFLAGGYNDLMQTIRDDIIKEQHDIQNSDIITFFQVTHFITAFHQKRILTKGQNMDSMAHKSSVDYLSLHQDLCGPIAATMNEAMYSLVISKWHEALDGVKITNNYKFLTAIGSLMKSMVRMLDFVLKLLPEDSKECQTARVLLYKLFYDQTDEGLTQFLLNRFKCFDSHKQPRGDLADLLEIIHIMLRLMEKLQAHGTLRVSKKSRKRKFKKKSPKDKIEVESELLKEQEIAHEHVESISEVRIDPCRSVKEKLQELNSIEWEKGLKHSSSNPSLTAPLDKPLQNIEHLHDQSKTEQDDKENEKQSDQEYESSSSLNTEELTTNEVNFNISTLISSFASNTVIHNLCWLLKHYKANSSSTNHYILCMLKRFCEDLELSAMFYQLSLLTTFYDILTEEKKCNSREYMNIINFLTKFTRKMFKIMKSHPLLFVEILFWKTRRECQHINAEVLLENIDNLRKDARNMVCDSTGEFIRQRDTGSRSIADALGEDEIDLDIPQVHHDHRVEQSSVVIDEGYSFRTKGHNCVSYTSEDDVDKDTSPLAQGTSKRDKSSSFTQEQDGIIRELYEKYKNERQCSLLIAEALDPNGKMSPALVSRKLKQLGLMVVPKKKLIKTNALFPDNIDVTLPGTAVIATAEHGMDNSDNASSKISSNKKNRVQGIHAISRPQLKASFQENDFDDVVLSSLFKDAAEAKRKMKYTENDGREPVVSETSVTNKITFENNKGVLNDQISEILGLLHQNKEVEICAELEDLIDPDDEVVHVAPRKVGSRKRVLLDFEDD